MVIIRTPLRVSFFGGGTDLPSWFMENGGAVLATAINKYIYITMRHLPAIFDFNHRVVWKMVEQVKGYDDIQHPVVREVLKHYAPNPEHGFEVNYNGDLPARSGLGSSSAFTVALLHALNATQGKMVNTQELAAQAIFVEQQLLKETVGCQDQITTAVGGLNRIDFLPGGGWRVTPITLSAERRETLQSHMMMFYTDITRSASNVEKQKVDNMAAKKAQMARIHETVMEAERILLSSNDMVFDFASLMDEAWQLKRSLAGAVSNNTIDEAYNAAMKAGAWGGKLLGAGGGGFMLFFAPPEAQPAVRAALAHLTEVPISMEREGSRVVLYDPQLSSNYEKVQAGKVALAA